MLVSVIIPTYNSRPYLAEALDALAAQTLDSEQTEILVVDDGSTDDTWDWLRMLAAERSNLRIFAQSNSGSAGRGRNLGLAQARGRYVFFNDADDYLGADALRRMTEVADAQGADVVLGRVRRFGAATPHRPSDATVLDADLIDDGVWRSLSPHKLFRRALLEKLALTFPEDQVFGEDQVFVATCLFAARKVSILGDYDFYHRRRREDRGNLSTSRPQTLRNKQLTVCRMTRLVVEHTEPGRRRDAFLRRVILSTLASGLQHSFPAASADEQAAFLTAVRAEVFPYLSEHLLQIALPDVRFRLLTARDGILEQLSVLKPVLESPWRYRVDGEFLCYDLGPDLNTLVAAAERRVRESFPLLHELVEIAPTASGLAVRIRADPGPVPYDRITLQARSRGESWVTLAEGSAGAETRLEILPPTAAADQRWMLRLLAYARDVLVAGSPLSWPSDPDRFPSSSRRSAVRTGGTRLVLKLYGDADGHARLSLRSA